MFQNGAELFSKYQQTLLEAEVGYWEYDLGSGILTWDEGYRRLFEKEEGVFEAALSSDFVNIHEDYREKIIAYFKRVLSTDEKISAIYRINSKKQDLKYIRLSATRIIIENKVIALSGVCWDFTTEFLLQQELKAANEFMENILDAIPVPVFVKNSLFETIYANSAFQQTINLPKEKFIGKNDFEVYPAELAEIFRKSDVKILADGVPFENEIKVKNHLGEERELFIKKSKVEMKPDINYLVGAAIDITELKSVQNSLIKQSKMASLGEMAAEIAHEVNNPLMIIQGKSQILLSKIKSKEFELASAEKDLLQIETNCMRIDKIIKSLKSVTRKADSDPFEISSLLTLIDEAFQISNVRFSKKKLNLVIFCDSQVGTRSQVSVRASEIVQVLVNLLNNSYDAIQHQPDGWTKINVSTKKSFFVIEVIDSGSEIQPDVALKMMEPFFTTKSSGKGTGLGLSVSKQIVRNHGGELYYDPARVNTSFIFTLPKI